MEPDDRARTQIVEIGVWALRASVLSSSDLAGLGSELVAAAIARVLSREIECLLSVVVPPAGQPSPETFCSQIVNSRVVRMYRSRYPDRSDSDSVR